jgi:small subunit ribosomal protein S16
MPTKIRLQRHGKKGNAFFHIVVADGRAPRDGKFIEKIGTYNPHTNPATIDLLFDKALTWLQNGAQPSDTAKAILSYKGVLYKNHLLKGVTKGALTNEQVEAKFEKWLSEKTEKIEGKKSSLETIKSDAFKKALAAETAANQARAAKIAQKSVPAPVAEEPAAPEAAPSESEAPATEGETPAAEA